MGDAHGDLRRRVVGAKSPRPGLRPLPSSAILSAVSAGAAGAPGSAASPRGCDACRRQCMCGERAALSARQKPGGGKGEPQEAKLNPEEEEALRNAEQLARDLRQGLRDLLELHNPDELRTLCVALQVEANGSRRANLSMLAALVGEGSEERDCRRVLMAVWDGILIEYLRKSGKNLLKCRDNLRGAVLAHWKRHTVALAAAASGGPAGAGEPGEDAQVPVYMRGTVWRRTSATSDKDVKVSQFLERLHESEQGLKEVERALRVQPDYQAVVQFLSRIHAVREMEAAFRAEQLAMLQELLGERDLTLESERIAAQRAREATETLEAMVAREKATNYFRGLEDVAHQQRVMEAMASGVRAVQQQRLVDRVLEGAALAREDAAVREGKLAARARFLAERLAEAEERWRMSSEDRAQAHAELRSTQRQLAATDALFRQYRADADWFVERTLAAQAVRETEEELTFARGIEAQAMVLQLQEDLRAASRGLEAQREATGEWRARTDALDLRVAELDALLAAERLRVEELQLAARPATRESQRQGASGGDADADADAYAETDAAGAAGTGKKGKKGKKAGKKGKKAARKKSAAASSSAASESGREDSPGASDEPGSGSGSGNEPASSNGDSGAEGEGEPEGEGEVDDQDDEGQQEGPGASAQGGKKKRKKNKKAKRKQTVASLSSDDAEDAAPSKPSKRNSVAPGSAVDDEMRDKPGRKMSVAPDAADAGDVKAPSKAGRKKSLAADASSSSSGDAEAPRKTTKRKSLAPALEGLPEAAQPASKPSKRKTLVPTVDDIDISEIDTEQGQE